MKTIQIPENTADLRDYSVFINAVKEFNSFESQIQTYCKAIVESEFLKTAKSWRLNASLADTKKLAKFDDNDLVFYNYNTYKFILNDEGYIKGWHMGETRKHITKFELSDCGTIIFVKNYFEYRPTRMSHVQFTKHCITYKINLLDKTVELI